MKSLLVLFFLYCAHDGLSQKTCIRKTYNAPEPSMVCVCNATYCDEFPPLGNLSYYEAAVYISSISGKRFAKSNINFTAKQDITPETVAIKLDDSTAYQTIIGFGGALEHRVANYFYNLNLSSGLQKNLLNAYFGDGGTGYTIGRVPMDGDDTDDNFPNDFDLIHFNLTSDDFLLKIPFVKAVKELVGDSLKLFTSPWTAPAWMKASGKLDGGDINSQLKGDIDGPYYKTWANYYIKFFEAYAQQGINFWGMTVQNEPISGVAVTWKAMFMNAEMHRDFIKGLLGPTLRSHPLTKDIFLMIMDDQRWLLPLFADIVLNDPEAAQYVNGIAVHWYEDFLTPAETTLAETHRRHPNVSIFATEATVGALATILNPQILGDWNSGIAYASDIIEDLQNWVTGWMDWLIWDHGGAINNPIIINETSQEFYKNPTYYALGHFSKLIRPGSIRIELTFDRGNTRNDLDGVAFITPDKQHVIVLQNRNMTTTYQVSIRDADIDGKEIRLDIEPRSLSTLIWNKIA